VEASRIVKALNAGGLLSLLALEVKSVYVPPQKAQAAAATGKGASQATQATGSQTVFAASGDTLSGLAQKYYGSVEYWPLLWDTNRGVVGTNPNKIRAGMQLQIPPFAAFTPAQLQDAKKRFPTWRNYP
jgi:LysM repeat protein